MLITKLELENKELVNANGSLTARLSGEMRGVRAIRHVVLKEMVSRVR